MLNRRSASARVVIASVIAVADMSRLVGVIAGSCLIRANATKQDAQASRIYNAGNATWAYRIHSYQNSLRWISKTIILMTTYI